jgi:drug/metabolite transporter (DMT)-like permease
MQKNKYYVLLMFLVPILGLSWPINKIGLSYISPYAFSAWRLVIATFIMFLAVIILKKFVLIKLKDLPLVLIIGLVQMGLFMLLINIGLDYVGSGRAAILVYTTPVWVSPIAIIVFHEKAGFFKYIGLLLAITGIIIMFSPQQFNWHNHNIVYGNIALLGAALCWSIGILCSRYMKWHRTPLELIPWQLLVGTILVLIFCLTHPHKIGNFMPSNLISVGALIYTSILGTAFTYLVMIVISKELPSTTVSISLLGIPILGIVFSMLILNETTIISTWAAILLILIGLIAIFLDNSILKKQTS